MNRSQLGHQLYQLLPAVYRERDNARFDAEGKVEEPGDLGHLLDAYGGLLDQFLRTLEQRYYDNFPDRDPRLDEHGRERSCQPWLLPYFAQLLDVDLVSPDTDGQREEVTQAVSWRQRKGTRVAAERIAEGVGQMEVEVQEGWQRLATTPRIGAPLLPEHHFGVDRSISRNASPAERARHPGLPSVTPDTRYASRSQLTRPGDPAARRTHFQGKTQHWVQANPGGAPCFPGSYQDPSLRTPDLRTPRSDRGHYHPRRVLLFAAPPDGLCDRRALGMRWSNLEEKLQEWTDNPEREPLIEVREYPIEWHGEEWPCRHYRGLTDVPLKMRGVLELDQPYLYRFENLWLDNKVTLHAGCAELIDCAVRQFYVQTAERNWPVLNARASLFNKIEAPRGLVQLEYCTVLDTLLAERLNLSDSISLAPPPKDRTDRDVPAAGCLRYSCVPHIPQGEWGAQGGPSELQLARSRCTHRLPVFITTQFGDPGCGVLHWNGSPEIATGAEDGGEMGAYHDARHQLAWQAVQDKLANYLPLGTEAALIPDDSLQCAPPTRR